MEQAVHLPSQDNSILLSTHTAWGCKLAATQSKVYPVEQLVMHNVFYARDLPKFCERCTWMTV